VYYSPEYKKLQQKLHATGTYGGTAPTSAGIINGIIKKLDIKHLLDYGCGSKLPLRGVLDPPGEFRYQAYDPMVDEYSDPPVPAEMVVVSDVLEHVEPEYIEQVLDHLEELTEVVIYATIHSGPAMKKLEDGRNAHILQKPLEWWVPKFFERFTVQTVQRFTPLEFFIIAQNRELAIDEV